MLTKKIENAFNMEIQHRLKEVLNPLEEIDFKSLERIEELGSTYSFQNAAGKLRDITSDLEEIISVDSTLKVPKDIQDQIISIAKSLRRAILGIQNFVVRDNAAATQEYDRINEQVDKLYDEDLRIIQPILERNFIRNINPEQIQQDILNARAALKEAEELKNTLKTVVSDAEATVKDVRNAFSVEGASFSSNHFNEQADEHNAAANKWFWAILVSITLAATLVIILFHSADFKASDDTDYTRLIQVSIFKLVLLSIAYLLIQQCLKNYKVNKHLYVLNRHRQLALSVYPLMANGTSDPEQANTIVGQAAKAVFDPGTSGYLNGEDNPNPVNLTEVINKFADRKISS